MNQKFFTGLWPQFGADKNTIYKQLNEKLENVVKWGKSPILGFPTMSPHKLGIQVFQHVAGRHLNNLLTHTRGKGEKGFSGIQEIERDLIQMVGHLLGATAVDGYVTPGGTEANIMGLWIGRNKLQKEFSSSDQRVAVLASPASHYSLRKACNLLGLGEGSWLECGHCRDFSSGKWISHIFVPENNKGGLHFVEADEIGRMLVPRLAEKIEELKSRYQISRFIISVNEGTTMFGSMDHTVAIGNLIYGLRLKWNNRVGFYIHSDSAYGGFVYPFTMPSAQWAFRVPEVDSLTIDPYKMGQGPMAEGIFLCRKPLGEEKVREGLQKYIERPTYYVNDEYDDTLCGSRSGVHAVACWAVIMQEGSNGFTRIWEGILAKKEYLLKKISAVPKIEVLPAGLNMVSFLIPRRLMNEVVSNKIKQVVDKYYLMWSWYSSNPEDAHCHPDWIVKFCITQDTKKTWLDNCVEDLKNIFNA